MNGALSAAIRIGVASARVNLVLMFVLWTIAAWDVFAAGGSDLQQVLPERYGDGSGGSPCPMISIFEQDGVAGCIGKAERSASSTL